MIFRRWLERLERPLGGRLRTKIDLDSVKTALISVIAIEMASPHQTQKKTRQKRFWRV